MHRNSIKMNFMAPAIGILITIGILTLHPGNARAAVFDFLTGSFTSLFYFGSVLNTAGLLITSGLGAAVAIKSGSLNLGAEGQIYIGGFTAAIILDKLKFLPSPIVLSIAILGSCAAPALLMLISAALKQIKEATVLLTSFLVSAAIIPVIDSLIAEKFRDPTKNLLATPYIADNLRFSQILPPSPLNESFLIAILLSAVAWYYMFRTASGRRLILWGTAPEFARYCGYSENKVTYTSLTVSGAFQGLTGFFAVCGTYYTCHSGFYMNMGWNGLTCALIANSNPIALIPAGLILSWLFTSADRVSLMQNFGFDMGSLIQGIVMFCISAKFITDTVRSREKL